MATATIYQVVNSGHTLHAFNGAYSIGPGDQSNIEVQRDSTSGGWLVGISADGKGNVTDAFQKFVTFDVSSLSGATVSAASLVLTTMSLWAGTSTWDASAYDYSWVDGTDAEVRYNWRTAGQWSLPVYAATGGVTVGTNTDATFGGTASLRTAIGAGSASLKMVISNDGFATESNVTQLTQVYTANTSTTLTQRPRLIVTYTPASPTTFSYGLIVTPYSPIVSKTYSQLVLESSPILYWKMNDLSGTTITDSSGSARNGTTIGSPTLGVPGLVVGSSDTAASFNGVNQGVTLTSASWMNSSSITVEAIVKPSALPDGNSPVHASVLERNTLAGNPKMFQLRIEGSASPKFRFLLYNSAGVEWGITGSTTVIVGNTYHITGVHNGSVTYLYVNGVLDGQIISASPITTGTRNFYVGSNAANRWWFSGVIDEVAWYGTALSPSTILSHSQAAGR